MKISSELCHSRLRSLKIRGGEASARAMALRNGKTLQQYDRRQETRQQGCCLKGRRQGAKCCGQLQRRFTAAVGRSKEKGSGRR